jgi:hypothetical protein
MWRELLVFFLSYTFCFTKIQAFFTILRTKRKIIIFFSEVPKEDDDLVSSEGTTLNKKAHKGKSKKGVSVNVAYFCFLSSHSHLGASFRQGARRLGTHQGSMGGYIRAANFICLSVAHETFR